MPAVALVMNSQKFAPVDVMMMTKLGQLKNKSQSRTLGLFGDRVRCAARIKTIQEQSQLQQYQEKHYSDLHSHLKFFNLHLIRSHGNFRENMNETLKHIVSRWGSHQNLRNMDTKKLIGQTVHHRKLADWKLIVHFFFPAIIRALH